MENTACALFRVSPGAGMQTQVSERSSTRVTYTNTPTQGDLRGVDVTSKARYRQSSEGQSKELWDRKCWPKGRYVRLMDKERTRERKRERERRRTETGGLGAQSSVKFE